MKELKDALSDDTVRALRLEIDAGRFPGVTFELAMRFALTNGIVPADDLPVQSILDLETWLRNRLSGGAT